MLPTDTDRWLLYCLSVEPDAGKADRLQGLSPSDWEKVVSRSAGCGVTPLLYYRLRSLQALSFLPSEIKANLKMAYLDSAARSTLLYHELGQLLGALREEQIPVIALKGVHLAQMVYGDVALRPMGDIDLLIRKSDLPRVEKKLAVRGYHPSGIRDGHMKYSHHLPFQPAGRGTMVEVHWTLLSPGSPLTPDIAGLWQRARPATLAGVKVKVLVPEDLLLYTCLHTSFCNQFPGIKPLCDIVEIVRHYRQEMDWEQVVGRAQHWQASRYAFLTLYIARELLAADIPDQVLARLKPDNFHSQVRRWAIEQTLAEKTNTPEFSRNFLELCRPGHPWRKVSTLLKAIFPSLKVLAHVNSLPLDSPRLRLYLLRLKEILKHYSHPGWRLLVNDKEMVALVRRKNALNDWLKE